MYYQAIQIVFIAFLITNVLCYQWQLGKCPIFIKEPCDSNYIKFMLTTGDSYMQEIKMSSPVLPEAFNITEPIKIIIHGYGGLINDTVAPSISKAYTRLGYNVIVVDWERLSVLPCYPTAALNTHHIGKCTAFLAYNLYQIYGISPKSMHVIGFSLGAHIASFASNHIRQYTGSKFGRITGLDPALPLFSLQSTVLKLDKNDAFFVDVIHTSAGTYGKLENLGHVDFYVNGGSYQPACAFNKYGKRKIRQVILCSHRMAGEYFAESITEPVPFVGRKCGKVTSSLFKYCKMNQKSSTAIMGEYCNNRTRGVYIVKTRSKPPFALGLNVVI